jgi:hypothetical protein
VGLWDALGRGKKPSWTTEDWMALSQSKRLLVCAKSVPNFEKPGVF